VWKGNASHFYLSRSVPFGIAPKVAALPKSTAEPPNCSISHVTGNRLNNAGAAAQVNCAQVQAIGEKIHFRGSKSNQRRVFPERTDWRVEILTEWQRS
jgi:hypothetical protein